MHPARAQQVSTGGCAECYLSSLMTPDLQPKQGLAGGTMVRNTTKAGGALDLSFIPPALRPAVKAYAFGYASAVGPRLLTLILQRVTRRKRRRLSQGQDTDSSTFRKSALNIIRIGFECQRFPTFCAVLAGGSTLLQGPLRALIERIAKGLHKAGRLRYIKAAERIIYMESLTFIQIGKMASNVHISMARHAAPSLQTQPSLHKVDNN